MATASDAFRNLAPTEDRPTSEGEQTPRIRGQLERAAAEAMRWLHDLAPYDPDVTVEGTADR